MRILLDTHTFIWFAEGAPELSAKARSLIEDMDNDSYVSIASLWEMSIKVCLGKLDLKIGNFDKVIDMLTENGFQILNIDFLHTLENSKLPFHHRDPFDRIILSQGIVENMNIVGIDTIFDEYLADKSIKRLW